MNLLLLSEGDAETRRSFSGISKSLVDQFRAGGHRVATGDAELYGVRRYLTAGLSFSPDRVRWRIRYRLGPRAFEGRSRRARRAIAAQRQRTDLILQIGATFEPRGRGRIPYVLYCDSNIRLAEEEMASGVSWAVPLTAREREAVAARERGVYQGAAAIFTLSERLRRSFIEDFAIDPARVHTVNAAPNLDASRIVPRSAAPQRNGPPTVLFVGREFERKGGDLLLEAFRRVRQRIPEAELLFMGIAELELREPGVRSLGRFDTEEPAGWEAFSAAYRAADVFCLPARFDPFPTVFLEAMFFGLPCVGTRTCGVPEMVRDGETGYTVAVNDCEALADRLLRLLGDPALARRMGEAGRRRAEAHFTWPAVAERMLRVMEPLVA